METSASTVGSYVDNLIALGVVHEFGHEVGGVGRPKRLLRPRAEAGWFAGIEFHKGGIWGVAVDFSGKVVARYHELMPPALDARQVLEGIRRVFCILSSGMSSPLLGVGLGTPGLATNAAGTARSSLYLKDWDHGQLERVLAELTSAPVHLEQGLRMIALAERWYGLQHRLSDFVLLGARTEFSVALVQGGRLTKGAHDAAGELGFWPCEARLGVQVRDLISAPAVYRRLNGLPAGASLPANLCQAFAGLRGTASDSLEEVAADFARIIGWLQLLLDPEVFILHGPVRHLGDDFCRTIIRHVEESVPALRDLPPRLALTTLGEEGGALGAACMAVEHWLPTQQPTSRLPGKVLTAACKLPTQKCYA